MFMTLVAIITLNSKQDIKAFTYVVGLSLGFYGAKGGVFTILSGGSNHVFGPEGSYIADNNDLALALVTTLPIIWYLRLTSDNKWLRLAFSGLAILVLISVVGSYSRGALLAGAVMLSFLWLKSRGKATTGLALVLVVSLVFMVMPEQWFERMRSIDDYHADASALGRLNAWQFAMNIAETNLLGGGFNVFTPRMFTQYAPEPLNHHAAHSIYFQVLGEHGFIGLSLFLFLMLFTWLTARRIRKLTQDRAEMKWAFDLATMCQVSVIGYAVGGAFLTLAYFDLYYDLIALIVVLERWVCMQAREMPPSKTAASIPQPQGIPL
jgi:probable O-glycosylation ligase (exosortase A-associated)